MKRNELIDCVERASAHDEKAIEALYQYTYPNMHSLAYSLCHNKNDVEDILQESYITAFSKLNTLVEKTAFVGWLKKIVVNTWRDSLRNKTVIHETTVYDVTDDLYEDWEYTESSQDIIEISETNREIWSLVQALPEHQRVCMVLYYYDEMKIDEIAEILGIPEGSVKSRLHYGRLKLREGMEQQGIHSYGTLTAPAAEATASPAMLAKVLAALETASDSGAAAVAAKSLGGGLAARLALSVAALLTAGGVIGGAAMGYNRVQKPSQPVNLTTYTTAVTTTAMTTTTTTAAATTTMAAPTTTATTAPRLFVAFAYETAGDGIAITRCEGNEPDVVIPETIDGMTVVAVGENAFKYNSVMQSVRIPSTVRAVGSGAFRECRRLRSVSLGSGVNVIGDAAFLGCPLQSVTIPSNVREIGIYAFAYCPSLTRVQVAEGTERIGYAAFLDCPALREVALPASVNDIGEDSFDGASPDLTVTAPEGTYAREYAGEKGFF